MLRRNEAEETKKISWKTRLYILGSILGATMGFLSAYLFAKEAEDDADDAEELPNVPATTLLGLALSIITLVRQIAETGRKKKDGKK